MSQRAGSIDTELYICRYKSPYRCIPGVGWQSIKDLNLSIKQYASYVFVYFECRVRASECSVQRMLKISIVPGRTTPLGSVPERSGAAQRPRRNKEHRPPATVSCRYHRYEYVQDRNYPTRGCMVPGGYYHSRYYVQLPRIIIIIFH
jgi:hypothetical protein